MKKFIFILCVISLPLVVIPGVVFAQCGGGGEAAAGADESTQAEAVSGEVVNTVCPVLEGAVDQDTPYTMVYEGKTIGFCCAECLEKFKEDPEKYLGNLVEEKS